MPVPATTITDQGKQCTTKMLTGISAAQTSAMTSAWTRSPISVSCRLTSRSAAAAGFGRRFRSLRTVACFFAARPH
jgi:hypothetical protein